MLLLSSTNDLVRVITGTTGSNIEVHTSWVDNASGTITLGRTNTTSITTNTTTTVVASPAGSTERNVKHINIRNNHASVATDVTVDHTDGTNAETLHRATLLVGETITFDQTGKWSHFDANGGEYPTSANIATQADMEGGASLINVVTPGRQGYHPGHPKVWCKAGITGNILASHNTTSVTDTGTGVAVFVFTVAFASNSYAFHVTVERAATALAVADQRFHHIRNILQLIGSCAVDCHDGTATTALVKDPTAWHVVGSGDRV